MTNIFGWIGSICFAICGAPQAYMSYKTGNSNGISWGLLILWMIGECSMIIYIVPKGDMPLLFNYTGNLLFVGTIIKYKLFPRHE